MFTMRVGNILPGERVTVRLVLTGPLPWEDGEATFRFPLVVAPRYIPGAPLEGEPVGSGTEPDTDAVPDASRITPPVLLPGFPNPVACPSGSRSTRPGSTSARSGPACTPWSRRSGTASGRSGSSRASGPTATSCCGSGRARGGDHGG